MSATSKKSAQAASGFARRAIDYEFLLAALPHPILVIGPANSVLYANAAAEAFMMTSLSVLRRSGLEAVVAFGCPLLALIEQVRRTGTTLNEYAVELSTPKFNGPKLVDVYGGPLLESADQILIMLQQRNMAQMIERQLTHRAAARTVSGMAAVLAHEIKNPLSGIRGAAQLLGQGASEGDRPLTQLICDEADRIVALVNRMEVFSDDRPLAREPVNIHVVLERVRRLAENGFAKGVKFAERYDPSLPPVDGNLDQLVQVFLNLVKNAAEAVSSMGGEIILSTSYQPGVRVAVQGASGRIQLPLQVTVQDNGSGIPEELRPHLFDPFVTTKPKGTGLGLALVAKIISDHGGVIEFESQQGRTIFKVMLPIVVRETSGREGT